MAACRQSQYGQESMIAAIAVWISTSICVTPTFFGKLRGCGIDPRTKDMKDISLCFLRFTEGRMRYMT
jgi:hypothetical protein